MRDLISYGLIDRAKSLLQQFPADAPAPFLATLSNRIEAGERLLRKVLPAVVTRHDERLGRQLEGIMILPSKAPTASALLVFGGHAAWDFTFADAVLTLRDRHIIFIKDHSRRFSLCALPRLGPDLKTNLHQLTLLLAALKVDSLFCLGESAGGFPALKFGLELKAKGVLVTGSPISLNVDEEEGADLDKYPVLRPLYQTDRSLASNVADEYAKRGTYPRFIMVYGDANERDARFAQLAVGLPGAKLLPLANETGHATLPLRAVHRLLPEFLNELFSLQPYTGPA